jgi:Glycosyltransferase family 87
LLPVNAVLPPVSNRGRKDAWLLQWRPGERKTVYLCMLMLGVCLFVLIVYLQRIFSDYSGHATGRPPAFGDFFALWSYAKIVSLHPATELYDFATLHARQVDLGMEPSAQNPFPYPPIFLLLVWPLSLVPYVAGYLVWVGGTLALFAWAVIGTCSRRLLCVLAVFVAPASVMSVASGQSGFLAAALMVAGMRLAGSRPIVAGILIGLLSYKPQLGFLVPIALASAGLWRAFGVASLTVGGLAACATWAFGWAVWPAWLSMLPAYAGIFDRSRVQLQFMPTVIANLRLAGCPLPVAQGVQAVVAIAVVIFVSRCFRRDPGRLAVAALLVGTFLATPHAFVYDLPVLTAAIVLFIEERLATAPMFRVAEVLILVWVTLFPVLMVSIGAWIPVSAVPLALFFGLIVWQHRAIAGGVRGSLA